MFKPLYELLMQKEWYMWYYISSSLDPLPHLYPRLAYLPTYRNISTTLNNTGDSETRDMHAKV